MSHKSQNILTKQGITMTGKSLPDFVLNEKKLFFFIFTDWQVLTVWNDFRQGKKWQTLIGNQFVVKKVLTTFTTKTIQKPIVNGCKDAFTHPVYACVFRIM